MLTNIVKFEDITDERGSLITLEENVNLPFPVKRVYYLYKTATGTSRGHHAHKKLNQVLIAVSGSVTITVTDGKTTEHTVLDDPKFGLVLGPGLWREMNDFSDDCVLLVLASEIYDETDYIRDYWEFLEYYGLKDEPTDYDDWGL